MRQQFTSSGTMQKQLSVTALSGGAVLAGTRTLKDWELASDLGQRATRFDRRHQRRAAAWGSEHYGGVSNAGPVVRSPIFTQGPDQQSSESWHEALVNRTFQSLKMTPTGEVGIDQLEASFAQMKVPIDAATFTRYACELLPAGTDSVSSKEFLAFHKAVWANQPASVRRYAGDPSSSGEGGPFQGATSVCRLMRSSSVPSGASLRELRDNEDMLRSAFRRYEQSPGFLDRRELPGFFQDVGLDLGINSELGHQGSSRLNVFLNSQVSQDQIGLHDLVELQNKYIATLETAKPNRKPQDIVNVEVDYDSYMKQSVARRPSSALKRQAQLQEKVDMVDKFRDLVTSSNAAIPPDSPGATRAKLMPIMR
jgi:hypothetical protein